MEQEIYVPGHYSVLEGDGWGIDDTVAYVCEQDVDARIARCQGLMNVFGSGGILQGFDDVSEALRMAAESVIVDDVHIVEIRGCP